MSESDWQGELKSKINGKQALFLVVAFVVPLVTCSVSTGNVSDGNPFAVAAGAFGMLLAWRFIKSPMPVSPPPAGQIVDGSPPPIRPPSPALVEREERIYSDSRRIKQVIATHVATLAIKRRQLIVPDEYGIADDGKWEAHVEYFVDRVISQGVDIETLDSVVRDSIRGWIEAQVDEHEEERPATVRTSSDGAEFEDECADSFRAGGWVVRQIGGPGDQGADLILERDGQRVAVQCKLLAVPSGNASVQQAAAGATHHRAVLAVVVCPSGFTAGARGLANSTGVLLLREPDSGQVAQALAEVR